MPPVIAGIGALVSSISTFAASSWLAGFAVRVVLSLGFSALARALAPKPKAQQQGIKSESTQTGGTDPQAFIIGRYATGGQLVAPPMTHGSVGKTPNAYLTYVIAVSDAPGATLSRLFINGEPAAIGGAVDPNYGTPVTYKGKGGGAWVKWYDGTQTSADPMLIAKYGTHAQRPWQADMIGRGTAYAILTFRFDHELYKGFPSVRFEIDGIPLYDPRKDPTMGGVGAQSWANPSTWAKTDNPAVMAYNILRGIALPGGDVWGGGWAAGDLPVANWIAAMNAADQPVALAAGGTEPSYRAGFEVGVDHEPADVIDELLKTCAGRAADVGGTMKIAVGSPGFPVMAITDADIIVTDEQSHALFPSLAQTHNGVHATFPDPASVWESRDAPPRYDTAAEARDGRRLIATVPLPACPYAGQVQRLMVAWVKEERRFRRHQLVLPPDATILEPLDVISWTSVRNGYSAKLFEVAEIAHDPISLLQLVSLREVDPTDYDWNTALELPWVAPVSGTNLPPPQVVPMFAATGITLDDAAGVPRRPAIVLTWDGSGQDDVSALEYELRVQGRTQVMSGATLSVASGSHVISAGLLPDTIYEARARFIAPRPVLWTSWQVAITPQTFISLPDFGAIDQLFTAAGIAPPHVVTTLPVGNPNGWGVIFLTADSKLYRWNSTTGAWVTTVDGSDIAVGTIDDTHMAVGSVDANRLRVGTVVAGLIAAGAVKAANMIIDGLLQIDATSAGFAMGKASAADFASDGIYMGRDLRSNGSLGYAFLMGTTIAGISRYLQSSADNGLQMVNASYYHLASTSVGMVNYTASQTLVLGVGTKSMSLDLQGGGGGGSGYGGAPGGAGGATIVQLYDGATNTGISWSVNGGGGGLAAGTGTTTSGQSSPYGTGGAAGGNAYSYNYGAHGDFTAYVPNMPAGNASGYGAGGGGYGNRNRYGSNGGAGGAAGVRQTILNIDVSAYADPRLVITVGAAGSGSGGGGAGSQGLAAVARYSTALIEAGVVPLAPTAVGTFTKPANTTGTGVFPNLGPGLWVVTRVGGGALEFNLQPLATAAHQIECGAASSVTFVTDGAPNLSYSSGNAITLRYAFHRMKL